MKRRTCGFRTTDPVSPTSHCGPKKVTRAESKLSAQQGDADHAPPRSRYTSLALVGAAFVPFLPQVVMNLWTRPHYQFFPILLVAVVVLIRVRWPEPGDSDADAFDFHFPALVLSWILLAAGLAISSVWLVTIALLFAAFGLLARYAGPGLTRTFFGPWCLLWLIVPLPFDVDSQLIVWLQGVTSRLASVALDSIGILHLMEGNVLEFPSRRMLVEEACSGIHSLYALAACAGLFAVTVRRPPLHSVLLVASALIWAGSTNALRVVTVAAAYAWYDMDLASGWIHQALGIAVFLLSLFLLASTDQFLLWLGRPLVVIRTRLRRSQERRAGYEEPLADNDTVHAALETRGSLVVGGAFCVLGLLQLLTLLPRDRIHDTVAEGAERLERKSLPAEQNGWKQAGYEVIHRGSKSFYGETSKTWTFESPIGDVLLSFDYPFLGWHELTRCYRGDGWHVLSRRADDSAADTDAMEYMEVELSKPTGEYGYLLYAMVNATGQPLQPPRTTKSIPHSIVQRVLNGPLARVVGRRNTNDTGLDLNTYQIQCFSSTGYRLSPDERNQIRAQLDEYCRVLTNRFREPAQ